MTLAWSKNCVLTDKTTKDAEGANQAINLPKGAIFTMTDTKSYVPVFTWSTEDDNKLLHQLKTRFKRTIK